MPWVRLICIGSIVFILSQHGITFKSWTFLELMGLICIVSVLSYQEGKPTHVFYRVAPQRLESGQKYKLIPVIDPLRCDGCNKCVVACGVKGLEAQDGVAILSRPEVCLSDGVCASTCPLGAISMQWVKMPQEGNVIAGQWHLPY